MEIRVLRRILIGPKRWHLVAEDIEPLPERPNMGRALRQVEKVRLLKMARRKREWQVARLALNTTMRACEIRGLRWRDVDLMEHTLIVRHSKTEAGERTPNEFASQIAASRDLTGLQTTESSP